MARLPVAIDVDPTLEAADRELEARENRRPGRRYLGMSAIGDECARKLWFRFHDPIPETHDAATHKRFLDGHTSEDVVIKRLRMAPGITLLDRDPETGRQWSVSDFEGQFRGNLDGLILGLVQNPTTWHVFEVKASADKGFQKLAKAKAEKSEEDALKAWNPTYYAQAMAYCGYMGLDKHYLVCCTPGVREWQSVTTPFDPEAFEAIRDKAHRVLTAKVPLAKISASPEFFACKWCIYRERCHGTRD